MTAATGWLVPLSAADPDDVRRLGGKGASLAAMTRLGLPVPPAFILSTELCAEFTATGELPERCWLEVEAAFDGLADGTGRRFGDSAAPLLVSVRSGAPVSMPGMMDTILNVGLSPATLPGLAAMTGDEAFAWDSYLRLLKMFGATVRDVPAPVLADARRRAEADSASPEQCAAALAEAIAAESGRPFPEDPRAQLREAVEAVLRSWQAPRARRYRRHAGIDDGLGTAVVVQAMVFGNLDESSGSGVAFSRDPSSGEPEPYGDFLANAQGEDVVSGERDTGSLAECRVVAADAYADLLDAAGVLERAYADMCDIEFTVERGKLWILQVRVGQRTGLAEVRIAADLLDEGVIDTDQALERISPAGLLRVAAPVFDPGAERDPLGHGVAASPGAAVGVVATSSRRAEALAAEGKRVVLFRPETSPDDIAGFIVASGIVTARGGRASHAAVVARGLNRPAVCGVESLAVGEGEVRFGERIVAEGELVSVDGGAGVVLNGAIPRVPPRLDPHVAELVELCDERRRVPVLATVAAPWADATVAPEQLTVCTDPEQIAALPAGAGLLVDPGAAADPQACLAAAGAREPADAVVLVGREWPPKLRQLPAGRWRGLLAGERGELAARLLAATAGDPDDREGMD